ncbi:MAG: hypothetical protein M3680_32465 [Myxococcota bacterium]|nr:hypothetical protein [Myxococcota bacterium]
MQEIIEVIRAAVTTGATNEQKAAGVRACRTIIAALDTEPGKPIELPGLLATSLATRPTLDQMLDLAITRLATIANARDTAVAPPSTQRVSAVPRQLPTGLRVPGTPAALPRGKPPKQPAMNPAPTRKP